MSCFDKDEVIAKNKPEDVQWLSLLSDSELDLLISLKKLVIHRAKVVGHEDLADNIDLKMLRALGFILMEYLKERLTDSPVISGLEASTLLNGCNLSNLKPKDNFDSMFMVEDVMAAVVAKSRKKRKATEQ